MSVLVAGAGLAGCETAWQLARRGVMVELYDIKPNAFTPAHRSEKLGELVCSNSLRAASLTNAVGLLKEEMRRLNSLVIAAADKTAVPAGGALAVDRAAFSDEITRNVLSHPNIRFITGEVTTVPSGGIAVIATGPLTTGALCESLRAYLNADSFYFYDAAAPIVTQGSVDPGRSFFASRYNKGTPDYINCPMTKEEYDAFYDALVSAEPATLHGFEDAHVFEGCMPVETMAKRGRETLLYGPLKPVGLHDPKTGRLYHAVVQLRRDNKEGTLYNLVGFQTHLKFGEQKRVFSMIPALKNAEFVRYGVMHRNTYINSPKLLDQSYRLKANRDLYFAGQITGVEGYVESAASGLAAGLSIAARVLGKREVVFPDTTAMGALSSYISREGVENFQPSNVNFGIMAPLEGRYKKADKKQEISRRALLVVDSIVDELEKWR